jgi:salicylate hydroxylase
LHGGELMNFVGVVERDDWQVESWTQQGSHDECLTDFAGWHEDVHAMIRNIDVPYKWALMSREPLNQWSFGRVTLLGDAAHPTLPFLAQGAVMAIEDGYVLARCLDGCAANAQDALKRFEAARAQRCASIVHKSTENGRRFHNPELANAGGAAAYVDREWTEEKIHGRYDWLFSYDVDSVPV